MFPIVQKDIPIPRQKRPAITPILKSLEVGDSFVVMDYPQSAMCQLATNIGIKITTKKEDGGFRVWRTE
jgi:uncharacterized protein (DUF2249 family)